jgi:adenylate cyclase
VNRCPSCGQNNKAHYKYCLNCGEELRLPEGQAQASAEGKRRCQECKADMPPDFKFCGACGAELKEA